jgi:hypothetical protein
MSEMGGPGGPVVGSITVEVVPDTSRFQSELKGEAGKLQQATKSLTADVQKATAGQTDLSVATKSAAIDLQAEYKALNVTGGALKFTQQETAQLAAATEQLTLAEIEHAAMMEKEALLTRNLGNETGKLTRHQGELRDVIRKVSSGQAPLSSLFSLGSIARLGAAGLAVGAVFQGLGHLEEALKVTGDEAFTAEGKFRNFGAALLKGDVVGGFLAINAHAADVGTQLQELAKEIDGLPLPEGAAEMQRFADKTGLAHDEMAKALATAKALGETSGPMVDALKKQESQLRVTGEMAQEYADKIRDAAKAADDLRIAANQAAVAQSRAARTEGQADDLAEARRQEALARAALAKTPTNIGNPERAAAYVKVVEAHTKVLAIRKQIAAENKRQDEDEKKAAEAKRQETNTINESIAGRTPGRQDELAEAKRQEAALRSAHASYKEVVLAHSKVIKIEQDIAAENQRARDKAKAIRDADAREAERLRKERQAERQRLAREAAEAAKEDIDYRRSLIDLEVLKAEGTPGTGDDERAYKKEIAFWEKEKKRLAKLGRAGRDGVVEAKREIEQWKQKIKGLTGDKTGSTPEDFFQAAIQNFREYGPGTSGLLSAQDARGDLAARFLGAGPLRRAGTGGGQERVMGGSAGQGEKMVSTYQQHTQEQARQAASLLVETRRQTVVLRRIATNTGRTLRALDHAGANADKVKNA